MFLGKMSNILSNSQPLSCQKWVNPCWYLVPFLRISESLSTHDYGNTSIHSVPGNIELSCWYRLSFLVIPDQFLTQFPGNTYRVTLLVLLVTLNQYPGNIGSISWHYWVGFMVSWVTFLVLPSRSPDIESVSNTYLSLLIVLNAQKKLRLDKHFHLLM
jgi:hypothetical protein